MDINTRNSDRQRIFVVGTDQQKLYHLLSVIHSADGSYYANLGDDISRQDAHRSYHASGQVHFKSNGRKLDQYSTVPPDQVDKVFNLATVVAHMNLLSRKTALDHKRKLQAFKPTSTVYVDLTEFKMSVNVHAFLVPPNLIDYLKAWMAFDGDDLKTTQIHIVTERIPWIVIFVSTVNATMHSGPSADFTRPESVAQIEYYYHAKYGYYPFRTDSKPGEARQTDEPE